MSENVLILYATETGGSEDVADRISRHCSRIHLDSRVVSMDAYTPFDLIHETFVIFLISTTGAGAEPRSMTELWTMLLRSDLPSDLFEDLNFAVFGLGDTTYEKFCWPAKKLSRRLASLGAREVIERGEGDDQHQLGLDGALTPWTQALLDELLVHYPLPEGSTIIPEDDLPPPRATMTHSSSSTIKDPLLLDSHYHSATVKTNTRITADGWYQDVRHLEFNFSDDVVYKPGDVAVIHPEASSTDVQSFLDFMGWADEADDPFVVKSDQALPRHLPNVNTLRTLFTRYLDFNAVPGRSFFQLLRHFTSNELERDKLNEFVTTAEGAEDLYEYCHRVRRTIREILEEFRYTKVHKEYIFDIFPTLRPRQFSIASSVKKHPREIQLCVAIVNYRTKLKAPRRGVCTSYLAALAPGDKLRIGLQPGLFNLPPKLSTPIICVGPGTGIAPMRSIIEQRTSTGPSSNTLYFGCRSASQDAHYESEWKSYEQTHNLTYRPAYSRDGEDGTPRKYVQDLIREDATSIWDLVGVQGAWVYISGSSNKMPAAVKEAIRSAAVILGGMSEEEAKEYVRGMEREGRLVEECWS